MHHFFFTKKFYRYFIVMGLCLAMMLAPLPCHAGKKKKAKARDARTRTVKVAKVQSNPPKVAKVRSNRSPATARIKPSCPPGIPFEEEVQRFIGIPYRRGGTDERGLDCSGLAQRFFSLVHGIQLPHNSAAQSQLNFLEKVAPREDELEASDLLFFGPGKKRINHVGIYLADGKFLHASPRGGVVISDLDEAYWQKRLIGSRRLKERAANGQSAARGADPSVSYSDWRVKDAVNAEQTLAMGVSHTLVDSVVDVNLGAFHTSTISAADPEAVYREALADGYSDVDHRQGVRAFVDFTPSQWLRITPSLSMVELSGLAYSQDERQHVYGLETAISPPQAPWHLAVSAHSSRTSSAYYPWRLPTADDSQSQRAVELAFSVGYRLGDEMTLSIYGARDATAAAANGDSGKNMAGGMSDLSVQLQWIF